jgi:3'-phosphoadenosine 5'-phosphosulfate sulfotransferase (PAPS reductase)/FAD synthetase
MICQVARALPAGWAGTLHPDPATVLAPGVASVVPNLHEYDLIVIRISGGKDSQAAMRETWRHVVAQGVDPSCVLVEYDELNGEKADEKATWPGTAEIGAHLVAKYGDRPGSRELARRQAAAYGFRFVVARQKSRPWLLEDIRTRKGKDGRSRFPDAKNRYCTSDHKRAAGRLLLTAETKRLGGRKRWGRPVRILTVMGFRAQESTGRARREVFSYDGGASGKGTERRPNRRCERQVWLWLPIHHWTVEQVWADIHASGVEYAWPYDAGMSRYSCAQCVLGSKADAILSAQIWPAQALRVVGMEREMGHRWQDAQSMEEIAVTAGVLAGAPVVQHVQEVLFTGVL